MLQQGVTMYFTLKCISRRGQVSAFIFIIYIYFQSNKITNTMNCTAVHW